MELTLAPRDSGDVGRIRLNQNALKAIGLQSVIATNRSLARTIEVSGVIREADKNLATISAHASGRISKLNVSHIGSEIEAGTSLYTLYSDELYETIQEYRLLYRQSLMKHSDLLAREHASQLKSLASRLHEGGLNDKQLLTLQSTEPSSQGIDLYSRRSGVVTDLYVNEGDYIKRGDRIMQIADLFEMWFLFDVYDTDRSPVRLGLPVQIIAPSVPNPLSGTISFIDPNSSSASRSVQARVVLQNPVVRIQGTKQRVLDRNVYASGSIKVGLGTALSIPRASVVDSGNEAIVFLINAPGLFERRHVRIGRRGDDHWEIIEGLQSGDSVAKNGLMLLEGERGLGNREGI
jgi:membrane fusion protein, copper/silver efflux system